MTFYSLKNPEKGFTIPTKY